MGICVGGVSVTYDLLIVVPGLVADAAGERTLDVLSELSPQPDRISLVDWSHAVHPLTRRIGERNRHGLDRRSSPVLDDLFTRADVVWSENLAAEKRRAGVPTDAAGCPWCPQCKAKAWAIRDGRSRGVARLMYVQYGDWCTPGAPAELLACLERHTDLSFAFVRTFRADWTGRPIAPPQVMQRDQRVTGVGERHPFGPGMMIALDRLRDCAVLEDVATWPASADDNLARAVLLANGDGLGVPGARDGTPLAYFASDRNPVDALIRSERAALRNAGPNGPALRPELGRGMMRLYQRDDARAYAAALKRRGVADRAALVAARAARRAR